MSTRALVTIVAVVVGISFAVATVSLAVSLTERDARISANTKATVVNARRQQRNCQRIRVIVELLDRQVPAVSLEAKLAAIDRRFPDVPACNTTEGSK